MSLGQERSFAEEVLASIHQRRDRHQYTRKLASIRLPADVNMQLGRAAQANNVTKTDIVVESLRKVLPGLLSGHTETEKADTTTIYVVISSVSDFDPDLLEQVPWD